MNHINETSDLDSCSTTKSNNEKIPTTADSFPNNELKMSSALLFSIRQFKTSTLKRNCKHKLSTVNEETPETLINEVETVQEKMSREEKIDLT